MGAKPRTLVTGATGRLGQALVPQLVGAGHELIAASRRPPSTRDGVTWIDLDLSAPADFTATLTDVDVVVHAATAPQGDTQAVDVHGTERLLEAAVAAGIQNFVYPSIVGVDEIPLGYYEAKYQAEGLVERSAVPATILRATQFYEFVEALLSTLARLPIWPVPRGFRLQPVAVRTVAERVVELATREPSGRVDPIGGPEIHSPAALAQRWRSVCGSRRPILAVPLPGAIAAGFRAGHATCPDYATRSPTWAAWLEHRADA